MPNLAKPVAPLTMIILGLLMGLPPIATDLYLPAMPTIAHVLESGPEAVQQTLTLFLLTFAVCQLFFGPLSDAVGRRPVMIMGLAIFCLASIFCASSADVSTLVLFRGLQGVGAAAIVVTVPAIIRDQVSGSAFSRVMGFIMMVMALAPLVAPLLGSVILMLSGWRMIFVVLAATASIVALLYLVTLGETLPVCKRTRFDLTNVARNYLRVFSDRAAVCYMLCSALAVAAMFGFLAASPFVYIDYYGVTEQAYGVLFALNILTLITMASISNRLVTRHGPKRMLGMAMGMILMSTVLLVSIALLPEPKLLLVIAVMLFIGTAGVINANAMALVLDRLGPVSGSASAVAGSLRFGLGAVAPIAVALLFDGTPAALAIVMAACGFASVVCFGLALLLPDPAVETAQG
ncbi:MAG: Bcr/CflA family multidrug efflux MFS transporter [Pseudomonas sp.]